MSIFIWYCLLWTSNRQSQLPDPHGLTPVCSLVCELRNFQEERTESVSFTLKRKKGGEEEEEKNQTSNLKVSLHKSWTLEGILKLVCLVVNVIDSPSHCIEHNSIMVGTNSVSGDASLSGYVRSWPPSSKRCHDFTHFWCFESSINFSVGIDANRVEGTWSGICSVLSILARHCCQFKMEHGNFFLICVLSGCLISSLFWYAGNWGWCFMHELCFGSCLFFFIYNICITKWVYVSFKQSCPFPQHFISFLTWFFFFVTLSFIRQNKESGSRMTSGPHLVPLSTQSRSG